MKLFFRGFEEERRTEHHQQCANTENSCLNTPSRERRGFQYTDIDDKGIVAQRPHSHQTSFTIDKTWRSEDSTTLRNNPIPRRYCRYFLASANYQIREAHDDSAIAVQKYKHLIAQRRDGFVDVFKIGKPNTDQDLAEE